MPKSAHFNNNKSAITHSDFVSEAIQDLLKTNRITEVNELPHVVNPLSVTVQNSGKKRLILDLRYVNKYIYKERIKIEDLRLMEQFLNPHDYMFNFGIKEGYHHIDIHKPRQKFLRFSWEVGENLLLCIYCPAFRTNVSTVYIYKSYEISCKTLENRCDQNSLLS